MSSPTAGRAGPSAMLEKISHVKNPLTVIAIFAGLAELGGTAVLPTLDVETQKVYVWFLMIFPHFLVAAFFLLLWKKHTHLYAPSDFADEKNFVTAAGNVVLAKLEEEAVEAERPDGNLEEQTAISIEDKPSKASTKPHRPSLAKTTEKELRPDQSIADSYKELTSHQKLHEQFAAGYLFAEELALAKISMEFGGNFRRRISPSNMRGIVFDAVMENGNETIIIEVKYRRKTSAPVSTYSFDRMVEYFHTLSLDRREKILFLFVVVVEDLDEIYHKKMISSIYSKLGNLPFRTQLRVYKLEDLQREFIGSA